MFEYFDHTLSYINVKHKGYLYTLVSEKKNGKAVINIFLHSYFC